MISFIFIYLLLRFIGLSCTPLLISILKYIYISLFICRYIYLEALYPILNAIIITRNIILLCLTDSRVYTAFLIILNLFLLLIHILGKLDLVVINEISKIFNNPEWNVNNFSPVGGGEGGSSNSSGGGQPNLPGGGPSNNSQSGAIVSQQNDSPNSQENSPSPRLRRTPFNIVNGKYVVNDPHGDARRGYLNPVTGKLYEDGYRPFCDNLADALIHYRFMTLVIEIDYLFVKISWMKIVHNFYKILLKQDFLIIEDQLITIPYIVSKNIIDALHGLP